MRECLQVLCRGSQQGVNAPQVYVKDIFKNEQYKNEFMQSLMVALNQLSAEGYSYNQITSQLNNLTNKTKDETANNWHREV